MIAPIASAKIPTSNVVALLVAKAPKTNAAPITINAIPTMVSAMVTNEDPVAELKGCVVGIDPPLQPDTTLI